MLSKENVFVCEGDTIYINVPYAEAYVPDSLFKETETGASVAIEYGDGFRLIGLFNMRFFESDTEPRENAPLETLNYPNIIETYPDSAVIQTLELIPGAPERYRVFRYYFGDVFMSAESIQAVDNCTKFTNMVTKGKITETIPYNEFVKVWENNFDINNFNPGVPSVLLQMVWAHMCWCTDDINMPFRMKYGKGYQDVTDYRSLSMNTVASSTSVFAGLSFEKITEKTASGIAMSRSGVAQMRSPIEEVLTM